MVANGEDNTKSEIREIRTEMRGLEKRLDHLEDNKSQIDDVLYGNPKRNLTGILEFIRKMVEFMEKWDKREYMARGVILLLGSNLVLTVLTIIITVFVGA